MTDVAWAASLGYPGLCVPPRTLRLPKPDAQFLHAIRRRTDGNPTRTGRRLAPIRSDESRQALPVERLLSLWLCAACDVARRTCGAPGGPPPNLATPQIQQNPEKPTYGAVSLAVTCRESSSVPTIPYSWSQHELS